MSKQEPLFEEETSGGDEAAEAVRPHRNAGQLKLLGMLREHEGKVVTLTAMADAAGLKRDSLRTYINKHWLDGVIEKAKGGYLVRGATEITEEQFIRTMTQSSALRDFGSQFSPLPKLLLVRSRTNLALAIESFNRVTLDNRLDVFVLLFIAAWEQLLKAEIEEHITDSIFTGETTMLGRRKTISFTQCLERGFKDAKDPVRRNLEVIRSMRDDAAHLLVSEVQPIATRYFQAGILNYCKRFEKVTGERAVETMGAGLLSLALPYERPEPVLLRRRYGDVRADEIAGLVKYLEDESREAKDERYSIEIDYSAVLVKKPDQAAIRLTTSADGDVPALIVTRPVDPDSHYRFRFNDLAPEIERRTGQTLNRYDIIAVLERLHVRGNSEYHRHSALTKSDTYCDRLIEKIVERMQHDPNFVSQARESWKHKQAAKAGRKR